MKGVSILAAVIAIAVIIVIGFFAAIFILSTNYERTLSDRVASAHTAINLFYAYNETLPVFIRLLALSIAEDLGENCGGVNCDGQCMWNLSCPTLEQLVNKYNSSIVTIFDSLPKNVGELGRINFTLPKIEKINHTENCINLTLKPHGVWTQRSGFLVNASSKEQNLSISVRYYLLLTIGRMLFEKGEYKITNSALSKTIKFADENEPECSAIRGKRIKVKNGKVTMPVDNFIHWAILCGIAHGSTTVHGLASLNDFYGEVSKSSSTHDVTCTKAEAVEDTDYVNIETTIENVRRELDNLLTEFYNDENPNLPGTCEYRVYPGYKGIDFKITTDIRKSYAIDTNKPPPKTRSCSDYPSCRGNCYGRNYDGCSHGTGYVDYYCSFVEEKGSCGCGVSTYCYHERVIDVDDRWDNGYFSHDAHYYSKTGGCKAVGKCDCRTICNEQCHTICKTLYAKSYTTSRSWDCEYSAYFVFDVNVKTEFKFTDNSILIPQRGSTAFEKLKLKLKTENSYHLSS